jgi:xylose isomerase
MRTYLILKEKGRQWNADPEIKALLANIAETNKPALATYTADTGGALLAESFDRAAIASKGLQYEKLDQLTIDILLGVR